MIRSIGVAAIAIALAQTHAAWADECGVAVSDYNYVLVRLNDATQRFSTCVADSKGLKDCSDAFNGLRSVYEEFQSAVALYNKACL